MIQLFSKSKSQHYFWDRLVFRIFLGFLLPILVSCYALITVSTKYTEFDEGKEKLSRKWFNVRIFELRAISDIAKMQADVERFARTKDPTALKRARGYLNSFENNMREVYNLAGARAVQASSANTKAVADSLSEFKQSMTAFVQTVNQTITETEITDQLMIVAGKLNNLERSVERLKAKHELVELDNIDSIKVKEAKLRETVVYIMVFTAIFSLIIGIWVTRSITQPVTHVLNRLMDIATGEGDLTQRVRTSAKGEMGEMARWMNLFLEKTHDIVATIADASSIIGNSTNEVRVYTERTSVSSAGINKNMTAQSLSVDECNSSLRQIDSLLQASGDSTMQAASLSKVAMDRALQGGASVHETVSAMGKIEESATKIEVLVGTVNEIASQTNLLAINAAIEASKAGEHGKGFAVVAEEVRKLAERSSKLTAEITDLITESNSRVQVGVQLATAAGKNLDGIIQDVEAVATLIQRIAASSSKQTASSTKLLKDLQVVSKMTKANLIEVQGVKRSAELTTSQVQKLDRLVNELNSLVGQFKLSYVPSVVHSNTDDFSAVSEQDSSLQESDTEHAA